MALRKVANNHRIFPPDEAVYKVIYLAMRNIAKKWTAPIRDWKPALNRQKCYHRLLSSSRRVGRNVV